MGFKDRQHKLLFPDPLYTCYFEDSNILDKYVELLYKDRDSKLGMDRIYQWKSNDDLHLRNEWKELCNLIIEETNNVFDHYSLVRDSIVINNMWGQIGKSENTHTAHTHPNSYFSGIIYLKTPPACGKTSFHKNVVWGIEPELNYNDINISSWTVTPEKGKMLIFPSWLRHAVQHGKADISDRITLAFTIMPITKVKHHSIQYNYGEQYE